MKKVYEKEWKEMMDESIKNKNMSNVEFLWSHYETLQNDGFFTLPF